MFEEARRRAGERGGVALPLAPRRDVWEAFLFKTGVTVRSLALTLLELGVLRTDLSGGLGVMEGETFWLYGFVIVGEGGDPSVDAFVEERESWFMLSSSEGVVLFVDEGIVNFL